MLRSLPGGLATEDPTMTTRTSKPTQTSPSAKKAPVSPDVQVFVDWMAEGLRKPGKNITGLATALGLASPQGSKIVSARRKLGAAELGRVSRYLELPLPQIGLPSTPSIPVVCVIHNGQWLEQSPFGPNDGHLDGHDLPAVPYAPVDVPGAQFAVLVRDETVNVIVRKGTFAIAVPYHEARKEPTHGDLVVAERIRNDHYCCIIRVMHRTGETWELRTASTKDIHKGTIRLDRNLKSMDGDGLILRGLVIAQYASLSN